MMTTLKSVPKDKGKERAKFLDFRDTLTGIVVMMSQGRGIPPGWRESTTRPEIQGEVKVGRVPEGRKNSAPRL